MSYIEDFPETLGKILNCSYYMILYLIPNTCFLFKMISAGKYRNYIVPNKIRIQILEKANNKNVAKNAITIFY